MIAPATANTIAKITHGTADNFLTTLVLALRCPLIIAPAMDVDMYLNDTTQRNIADAETSWDTAFLNPMPASLQADCPVRADAGGRPVVHRSVRFLLTVRRDLTGRTILVTAGPTYEPIDPVRYIGNRSSGKMGFAVATAAAQRGADVTLSAVR